MKYIDVVVENSNESTDRFYTYRCEHDDIKVGNLVMLPFARSRKTMKAVVMAVHDEPPKEDIKYRDIEEVVGDFSLNEEMVMTAIFLRARYLCRYMEALSLFMPSGKASKRGKKRLPFANLLKKNEGRKGEKPDLNFEQKQALDRIRRSICGGDSKIFLVQGVTGSGKTELYMESIEEVRNMGRTAMVLVPEIALTAQMVVRFAVRFGIENIAVLHSRLSQGERYDEWQRIRNGEVSIVLGARSAVFAPLENIGLIVLDEEHEGSYKSDQSPKYETVDVAVKRAKLHDAVVLLGSATPSIISKMRVSEGLYELLRLENRYNGNKLPKVQIVDMRKEILEGNTEMISRKLYEDMSEMLAQGRQVILFLNRRGYSPVIVCRECGAAFKCPDCDISLTYHKEDDSAHCHYCGKKFPVPQFCNACESDKIKGIGAGTEKVEESVAKLFPNAVIQRLDMDTAKRKGSVEKIIEKFGKNEIDILIGTQIIAKGLDFKNVGIVGVILADTSLNIPDFRASERTFQLITQVVGRAGRGSEEGKAIVQTYQPENFAIVYAAKNDYENFFVEEIEFRKLMNYPPFCDLLQIVIIAKKEEKCEKVSEELYRKLIIEFKKIDVTDVFMPQKLLWNPQKEHFRYGILIKAPRGKRQGILSIIAKYKFIYNTNKKFGVQIAVDVNPY